MYSDSESSESDGEGAELGLLTVGGASRGTELNAADSDEELRATIRRKKRDFETTERAIMQKLQEQAEREERQKRALVDRKKVGTEQVATVKKNGHAGAVKKENGDASPSSSSSSNSSGTNSNSDSSGSEDEKEEEEEDDKETDENASSQGDKGSGSRRRAETTKRNVRKERTKERKDVSPTDSKCLTNQIIFLLIFNL